MIAVQLIALIPLALLSLWLALEIRNELRLTIKLRAPACCAYCFHETTPAVIARERCPECGTLYMLGGIDAPYLRLTRQSASGSVYIALLVTGLAIAIAVASSVSMLLTPLNARSKGTDWTTIGTFLVILTLTSILPCILIHRRRKRLLRDLRTQMLPPPTPSSPSPPPS